MERRRWYWSWQFFDKPRTIYRPDNNHYLHTVVVFWIDARYNRWYRRVSLREQQIQKFINDRNYVLPSTGTQVSFDDIFTKNIFAFPVYDLSGEATFGKEPHFMWGVSLAKSLTDTIPLFVYGSQIL